MKMLFCLLLACVMSSMRVQSEVTGFCQPNEELCHDIMLGSRCYDPATHVCANGRFLCHISAPMACGDACYHPDLYSCQNGQLYDVFGHDANLHAAQTLAFKQQAPMQQNEAQAWEGQQFAQETIVQQAAQQLQSDTQLPAYGSPQQPMQQVHEAVHDHLQQQYPLTDTSASLSAQAASYLTERNLNPANTASCNNLQCTMGDQCCSDIQLGAICFNPHTHTCVEGKHLCDAKSPLVCQGNCYNPNFYRCSAAGLVPAAMEAPPQLPARRPHLSSGEEGNACGVAQCMGNDQCCQDQTLGPVCFNPATHTCADGLICPRDFPQKCGYSCYNPNIYDCNDGQLAPRGQSHAAPTRTQPVPPAQPARPPLDSEELHGLWPMGRMVDEDWGIN